jgi:RNA polymerase III RPC4
VHASGRMTLKAGDVIYEVQPGLPCYFAQDVATLWPEKKQLCILGKLKKKLVCLPEFSALALDDEGGGQIDGLDGGGR